ncbi:NADP-dependent oxidoreductase [Weissella ceti]|uniref:NADP-dependent oxidoreductase n=1 Tax=Weissella ceti TaxID=759620 RepID=A0ABT3E4V6_9LACO|nr:NADP-dependent oxidoreductase [Weissella ceti]MCW0953446.1 NADP-dependent oxidoreductase [Weissella ceti]QVK12049.1 NADP-dependent oxidoreductase [Weissella ceti]
MLAIEMSEFGTPAVLKATRVDTPEVTPNQVLVQNHAIAIDPYDVKFVAGMMGDQKLPVIPGSSVVGEVIAVGDKVTDYKVGDRVAASRHLKTYAEQVPVHQKHLAKVPDNISDELAVASVLGAATGYEMITAGLDVQPDQNILITGAAGAVGSVAVQAALLRGANVYALVRPNQAQRVEALGNVTVIDADSIPSDVTFDGALNTITDDVTLERIAKQLSPNGKMLTLLPVPTSLENQENVQHAFASADGNILANLLADMSADKIHIAMADTMPFNEKNLQEAHRMMLEDHPQGKLVLTF